jgi:cell division protein FtsI (penicillin-binding protein 3)
LLVIFAVVGLVFAGLIGRVAMLQTAEAQQFVDFGQEQRMKNEILTADRGIIFDRNGEELAISVPATTFYANPQRVVDPVATAAALAQMLQLSETEELNLATDLAKDNKFVYVARQLDLPTAKVIQELELPGIGWYDEPRRAAPAGDLARGVVGRTDTDGNGISGLEKQYDSLLNGTPGRFEREVDEDGRSIPGGKREIEAAIPGDDLVLTIARPIQYQAEQALMERVKLLGARGGTALVMNPTTGELYANASVRIDEETGEYRVTSANIAAVDAYEPGSVAKVITVAAALNEKTVTPDTWFDVPWRKKFYDLFLSDAEQHPTQSMSVARILAKSSNIGTIFISQTIGFARQEAYMRAFGFGSVSALDFPGESRGIFRSHTEWQGTEKVTVAYGQGVAATALQLLGAVNTIANDGRYVDPKLVRATIDASGELSETPPSSTHEVITPETAQTMNVLMRDVVCAGTASQAKLPGYTIAGKTGTGYKAQANGTYFKEDGTKAYYASFVGFLPAEDPKVTILVSIDEPPADGDHFGGNTAAPTFARIAEAAVHELGIQPPTADGGCPEG